MSFINRKSAHILAKSVAQVGGIFQQSILPAAVNSTTIVRTMNRSLVVLSTPSQHSARVVSTPSSLCSCGCGINGMHTRGDRELVEFLQDEIISEKKSQTNSGKIPSTFEAFNVKGDRSEIILEKKFNDEEVKIVMNVNHTIEPNSTDEAEQSPEKSEEGDDDDDEMSSKPDFEIDVKIGNRTLSFTCQFTTPQGEITEGDHVEDNFSINEVTFFEGEHHEKTYCVAGEILDGMLYDLFMNYLEERGISADFVDKLSGLCTSYEHSQYIGLLENVQDFVKRK